MNPADRQPLRRLLRLCRAPWRSLATAWRVIGTGHGHRRSMIVRAPVDAGGRAQPWFTYPAIEYLAQFDLRDKTVFEFGAGNSTLYWARRAGRVVAVESDPGWFEHLRPRLPANAEVHFRPDAADYEGFLMARPEPVDLIVVDGIRRRECCRAAVTKLQPGGLVVLDNADWHHRSAAVLRAAGLLQVDFTGLGPVNDYAWTTSLFFERAFAFPTLRDRQPAPGIGSLPVEEAE